MLRSLLGLWSLKLGIYGFIGKIENTLSFLSSLASKEEGRSEKEGASSCFSIWRMNLPVRPFRYLPCQRQLWYFHAYTSICICISADEHIINIKCNKSTHSNALYCTASCVNALYGYGCTGVGVRCDRGLNVVSKASLSHVRENGAGGRTILIGRHFQLPFPDSVASH